MKTVISVVLVFILAFFSALSIIWGLMLIPLENGAGLRDRQSSGAMLVAVGFGLLFAFFYFTWTRNRRI